MIERSRIRLASRADAGFTLVELLVYTVLFGMVISVIGGIMIGSTVTEQAVRGTVKSTTEAQLAASSIASGIRNSSAFQVTDHGTDRMLSARVARGDSTLNWLCAAWYYDADGDQIRYFVSPSAIAAPSASQLADWTELAVDIEPITGSDVFEVSSGRLDIAFLAQSDDLTPTEIVTSATRRTQTLESAPCF